MPTIFSYWLLPAEPVAAALRSQIAALAQRYDAIEFEPHITLYSGRSDDREVKESLDHLRQAFRPLTVVPFVIAQSSRLTKTLYIRLELNSELAALADTIRGRSIKGRARQQSGPVLDDPHVSLLYQTLAEEERAALSREIALPAPFLADGIAVIETENPLVDLDQFRRWRFVARFRHGA